MNYKILLMFLAVGLCCGSCKKVPGCTDPLAINYNTLAEKSDGSCKYSGDVSFWTNSNLFGDIDVSVDGIFKGTIENNFSGYDPTCGQNGTLTVTLSKGAHPYTANSTLGWTWSGTITVDSECRLWLLHD